MKTVKGRNVSHSLRLLGDRVEIKRSGHITMTLNRDGIDMALLALVGDDSEDGLDRAFVLLRASDLLEKQENFSTRRGK